MTEVLPATIHDVETPCFLVDIDRVKHNVDRMRASCDRLGLRLRAHTKTHKTIEGADLCTAGSRRGIVVSTYAEAKFYADNGYDDILWASPIIKERLTKRVVDLANRLEMFHVLVTSMVGIEGVISTARPDGNKWGVFLELDCGYGRTGCRYDSDELIAIAKRAVEAPNVDFQGLYAHCGNTYIVNDETKKAGIQRTTLDAVIEARDRLKAAGIDCKHYELGSTPGCSRPLDGFSALTGVHPGNFIFYDYQGVITGSCEIEDIACKVATTVICHMPHVNTLMTDGGWTSVSQDGQLRTLKEAPLGYSPVEGHPELRLDGMTQELGKIVPADGKLDYSKYPLGTRLYIYPHHSCAMACMHKVYYIHSGEKIVGMWKPCSGW